MRLTELTLENYGCYDRRDLIIPEGAGLTVVYGPNEAGKSTCLGVPAVRVDTAEGFHAALKDALAHKGPRLIEAMI